MGERMSYIFVRPLLWIVGVVYGLAPLPVRRALARVLAVLLSQFKLRARVVRENLALAYPNDPARRERLFRDAYLHLATLSLEILMLLGPSGWMKRFVLRHGKLKGLENWRAAHESGKGVLFLSSHVGNWEIMAATGALHGGMDLMIVTKHLKPEWLHRAIERGRAACGVSGTYEPRTLKDVLGHLKRGGTVGFVLDQYTGPPVGFRVPVFGVPVGTSGAIATLARRTGAVVLPVVNYREKDGTHVTDIRRPLDWIRDEVASRELGLNTARYAQETERDIYAHPEQWLWIHRRFKGDMSPLRPDEWAEGRVRN